MAVRRQALDTGWVWKERDMSVPSVVDEYDPAKFGEGWNKAETVPSEIHVELMRIKKIPDPYVGGNEHKVQWVGEKEWLYATTFEAANPGGLYDNARLVFEGLDTFCDVYLNGKTILNTDNMFMPYSAAISPPTPGQTTQHTLLLHFKSAKLIAKDLEKKYGRVRAGSVNLGDPSRVYVRKAQYDWRWDWGPELLTAGPWKPVYFEQFLARLNVEDTHVKASVSEGLTCSLAVDVVIDGDFGAGEGARVKIVLCDLKGEEVRRGERVIRAGERNLKDVVNWDLSEENDKGIIKLWWPVGCGDQSLYDVEVILLDENSNTLDAFKKRIGFRRVKLIQDALEEPDQYGKGTTFYFEVNGRAVFIGGSNWIPADNFLTTIKPERYRAWLELMRDGNQNMVRVWGGGIYEPDIFYSICDELGLLVWQDFAFACGVYPAHTAFVASVKAEAEANVKRLREHPCLALFCGNNEDYQQVLQWGGIPDLPARLIYEDVLPAVVKALTASTPDIEIPYWRSSPYGGKEWFVTDDASVGDVHQWNVWAGAGKPYQDYDVLGGRFVSEFGLPAFPAMSTINHWMQGAPEKQWYAQSKMMLQHNKAGQHERRFAVLMNDNFRVTGDFESHVYLTQLMQSEGVGFAYRSWRREWRGKGKEYCGGVLVWQLNDCWPATSWSIADYFLRAKPVYYAIAREMKPITVGIARVVGFISAFAWCRELNWDLQVQQNRESDRPRQFYEFGAFQSLAARMDVWATNSTTEARRVTLEYGFVDLNSEWTHKEGEQAVVLAPNQSTEMVAGVSVKGPPQRAGDHPDSDPEITSSHSVVVWARLLDPDTKQVLARAADWPQPYRVLDLPNPGLAVEVEGDVVRIAAERPVKGLVLSAEGAAWEENCVDVLPGDPRRIRATGIKGPVYGQHLGAERRVRVDS
ncbi:glycoside hydrolase family 2 protein [Sphaerobolus stellatus SS14]|uniref:Beta-mannosidase B n=1 Tax=Sphaerobolus stellatus (strain SS14) TaxID=990650 RepID=A0A0C9U7G2_SPHS4|nr:glycoside hydrolase family 2 protein [Sphaerobolus stellatus SS14]